MKNKTLLPFPCHAELVSASSPRRNKGMLTFVSMTALSVVLLCATTATAQTNVSGFISANTTWNLTGSPYVVVGNTLVMIGVTLTIDPGVIVKLDTGRAIQIDGELHAVGTPFNRITFTSNQPVPAAGDWARIQFADSCIDAAYDINGNYLSGSIMKYCDVKYGGRLNAAPASSVEAKGSSPYISNCNIISSAGNGIGSIQSTVIIDSSSIKNCAEYGIYFGPGAYSSGPTRLTLQYDTIAFNQKGGIIFSNFSPPGSDSIRYYIYRNYFMFNSMYGAIYSGSSSLDKMIIAENIFESNGGSQGLSGALNISASGKSIIECNRFINNQGLSIGAFQLVASGYETTFVRNNIFLNNSYTGSNPFNCIFSFGISNMGTEHFFTHNTFKNNIATGGSVCRFSGMPLQPPLTTYHVDSNEFSNNIAANTIHLGTYSLNFTDQFVSITSNNFANPSSTYEIYNNGAYGGANIDADSNYWNSTNTQHIDSVIYDFFDNAARSVVYYLPILSTPVYIDTSCSFSLITSVATNFDSFSSSSTLFPNPFTTTATLKFSRAVNAATLHIYNMYGQLVAESSNINGETFHINAEHFRSGVYVYEVTEKEKKICGGKAVVY